MRRAFFLSSSALAFAAAAACATSNDEVIEPSADAATPDVSEEAGAVDATAPRDGATRPFSTCSDAGWCLTDLPDDDLVLRDVWPFDERAFAIAESATLGVKVMEWTQDAQSWKYIDDDTQNEYGAGYFAGKLWAPSENEVYWGVAPAYIYHGKRSAPGASWSWERRRLDDNSRDTDPSRDHGIAKYWPQWGAGSFSATALGVWGTSADDVYAWYANTIFHWTTDENGVAGWKAEYVADDADTPNDHLSIFSVSGSSRDDVWFGGGRTRYDATGSFACPLLVHKTSDGYQRVVDSDIDESDSYSHTNGVCHPKAGMLGFVMNFFIPGYGSFTIPYTTAGWMTSIASKAPGSVIGIQRWNAVAYVGTGDGGVATMNQVNVTVPRSGTFPLLDAVWMGEGKDVWLAGWGLVLRTEDDQAKWSSGLGLGTPADNEVYQVDAATYSVSTTVLNGAPLDKPLYQVRGSSSTNLWAIGAGHALHKTTP